jgi:hypothetical protein
MEVKMGAKLEVAKHRLFDVAKLDVSDVKLFPGSSRDVTSEQIAEQVSRVIAQLENGDYELVEANHDN